MTTLGELTMNHTLSISAPLSERLYFNPSSVTTEEVIDVLRAYEAILDAVNGSVLDTMIEASDEPLEASKAIDKAIEGLTSGAIESMADNPYKDFFDDCVGALNNFWPAASIEDERLKMVILDAIAKGDTD
jgi:hypothetical protein